MKSILIPVGADPQAETRLQAGLDLARFTGGTIDLLQSRRVPAFLGGDAPGFTGSATMIAQLLEEDEKAANEERRRMSERMAAEGVPFHFAQAMGDPATTIVEHSLLADAIVMNLAGEHGSREAVRTLGSVVTRADAPVLAVPAGTSRLALEKPALVAWKPTTEAANAVRRAVPLLQRMSHVHVLTIDPPGMGDFPPLTVASYLSRHGIHAEMHERHRGERSTSDTLLAAAAELGAGLVVMGAYGRSRAMEFLLGGVTRRLLAVANVPLLMAN